jgi:phosphoenolpyruvate synthase/pyruvate phosphate dikinase
MTCPSFLCPALLLPPLQVAIANGAQGIGLTRTEHMFFATHQRIAAVRRMIAAVELQSPAAEEALKELQGYQTQDFEGIFRAMDGKPVTIRLLDPPLHEFLPQEVCSCGWGGKNIAQGWAGFFIGCSVA